MSLKPQLVQAAAKQPRPSAGTMTSHVLTGIRLIISIAVFYFLYMYWTTSEGFGGFGSDVVTIGQAPIESAPATGDNAPHAARLRA